VVSRFDAENDAKDCEQDLLNLDFDELLNTSNEVAGQIDRSKLRTVYGVSGTHRIEFQCVAEAERSLGLSVGKVRASIRNRRRSAGYYWTYNSVATYQELSKKPSKVFAFHSDGTLAGEFASYVDAAKHVGVGCGIIRGIVLRGTRKPVAGLVWSSEPEFPGDHVDPRWKPVVQKTKSGNVIATYNSLKEAQHKTGINFSHISECVRGRIKSTGGFRWEFAAT
jgi:hypothetical protein